jgi:hypothetical protein
MIKSNLEALKVGEMSISHCGNEFLLGAVFSLCSDHDGGAMRIISAQVNCLISVKSLEACEYICLDILNEMPKMNMAVGVWKGRSNQNSASFGH